MYINDLIKYIINLFANECKIQLFADDTLLYVIGETEAEIEFKLQSVFIAVQEWLRVNKLIMNVEKTKFMILHSGRNIEERETKLFTTDLKEIQRVYKMKYLGVIIDSKLNFKDYIEYIVKKTGKKINMLNRIGQYINGYTRCLIYKSIIAPHFDYCATILVGAQKSEIKKLQIQQNRAMRVIIQCNRYTPVVDMLDTLKFMSIKENSV